MKTYKEVYQDLVQQKMESAEDDPSLRPAEAIMVKDADLLRQMIEKLETLQFRAFLEDILLEEEESLSALFNTTRLTTAAESAFNWLIEAPYDIKRKAKTQFNDLFGEACRGAYAENGKKKNDPHASLGEKGFRIIDRILAISIYTREGLSSNFMLRSIRGKALTDPLLKLELHIALAKKQIDNPDKDFWEGELDLQKEPLLAIALLAAYQLKAPEEGIRIALTALDKYASRPQPTQYLHYLRIYLKGSLKEWLKGPERSKEIPKFLRLQRSLKSQWLRDQLQAVLSLRKLSRIKADIDKVRAEAVRAYDFPTPLPKRKSKPLVDENTLRLEKLKKRQGAEFGGAKLFSFQYEDRKKATKMLFGREEIKQFNETSIAKAVASE